MTVLLVLNVNILAVRVIYQSCGIGLVFSVILDSEEMKQKKDRGGGGCNHLRAAIISNILTKHSLKLSAFT